MKFNFKINAFHYTFLFLMLYIITIICSILIFAFRIEERELILLYSWIANISFFIGVWSLYKIENNQVNLLHIIILFAFLFNFGQTIFWSIGIHYSGEIGSIRLYSNYHIPGYNEVIRAQAYSVLCFMTLVFGVLFTCCFKSTDAKKLKIDTKLIKKTMCNISYFLAFLVIPLTFIKILLIIRQSLQHGYTTLYYSDFSLPGYLNNVENFFFPVLLGILIGTDFRKKNFVYAIFSLFCVLYLLAGERGNWIYKLLVLIWLHNRFYRKISYKKVLKYGIIAFFSLYLVGVIVDLRSIGLGNINFNEIISLIDLKSNPILRFIFEMGGSLGVTVIVLNLGRSAFPFFNTFITSLLSAPSSAFARSIGIEGVFLGNYLSQDILQINYGTGFNFFAEGYINGGIAGGMIYMGITGIIIALILKKCNKYTIKEHPLQVVAICSLTPVLCSMFRDSSLTPFKLIFQIGVIYIGCIYLYCRMKSRR